MLFNSYEFVFAYLPIVFFFFFVIARSSHKLAALWLALASVFFYGWWNPKFVSLLLASICFNYCAGYLIGHLTNSKSKAMLIASVVANLILLAIFKYANFFISTANEIGANFGLVHIILPAGISFFTFTQIAFLVDTHRGVAKEYNFIHYLLFVTWFPHLIAGPVIHHKQMMPQFSHADTYRLNSESISVGLTLFSFGLFKKVILADQFALFANPVFDSAAGGEHPMLVAAWIGALAYTLQLYFDFSGYSDMAIGLSRMFNIKLPLNFNSPYKATNIIDFWRRWHITLSNFLRDYLYFSLGGNKKGPTRRHLNLMITMLLGGLWHGAGWNFVLWGGLHGIYLVINHCWRAITRSDGQARSAVHHILSVLITFVLVVIAWVPFRASSIEATLALWHGMLGFNGVVLPYHLKSWIGSILVNYLSFGPGIQSNIQMPMTVGVWIPFGLFVIWAIPNTQQLLRKFSPAWDAVSSNSRITWSLSPLSAVLAGVMLCLSILSLGRASEFLYFQF